MKKIASILLVLLLASAMLPAVFAAAPEYELSSVNGSTATPTVTVGGTLNISAVFHYVGASAAPDELVLSLRTGNDVGSFPFEISQISYTLTLSKAAGDTYVYAVALKTRSDAASGYYTLNFTVDAWRDAGAADFTYPAADAEIVSLTVKVNATPAPPAPAAPATPKVIISRFSTNPSPVAAGDRFSLYITLRNTGSVAVTNLKAQFSSDGTFSTVSGSTTIFIESIPAGGTVSRSIYLLAKSDAVPGSYNVSFALDYDVSGIAEPVTGTEALAIPVVQTPALQISELSVSPTDIYQGQDVNVMSSLNNTGKSTLYNVNVSFSASEGFSSLEKYIGNIQSGATGNVDVYITPEQVGDGRIVMTVTFEDEQGQKYTKTMEYETEIMEQEVPVDPEPVDPQPSSGGGNWWIFLVVGLVVAGIVTFIILKKRRDNLRRQRDLAEAEKLDEQLLNSDGTANNNNNISGGFFGE